MFKFLEGKKTYLVAFLVALDTLIYKLGYINEAVYTTILGFLGAGGLASLRAGMTKNGAPPV